MPATINDLETRLAQLEQEMKRWQKMFNDMLLQQRRLLIHESTVAHPAISASWYETLKLMGIEGVPINTEKLHLLMNAEGVKTDLDNNEFSRHLISMREE